MCLSRHIGSPADGVGIPLWSLLGKDGNWPLETWPQHLRLLKSESGLLLVREEREGASRTCPGTPIRSGVLHFLCCFWWLGIFLRHPYLASSSHTSFLSWPCSLNASLRKWCIERCSSGVRGTSRDPGWGAGGVASSCSAHTLPASPRGVHTHPRCLLRAVT